MWTKDELLKATARMYRIIINFLGYYEYTYNVFGKRTFIRNYFNFNVYSELTVERAQQFIPQFLSKVHMECLIHGNITKSEAIETAKLVESKLTSAIPQIVPLLPGQMILHREVKLEDGK